jgi:tetratricopeptide (TPR) repeat protein
LPALRFRHAVLPGTGLAWTVVFTVLASPSSPAGAAPASPPADSAAASRRVAIMPDSVDRNDHALRRAAYELSVGNLSGVVESLEPIGFGTEPTFAEADRAAFLLGHAYLRLGSQERFIRLARSVARWQPATPYTSWLGYQLLLLRIDGDAPTRADTSAADRDSTASIDAMAWGDIAAALAAGARLREGDAEGALRLLSGYEEGRQASALALHFKAAALAAAGRDDEAERVRLAAVDTTSVLGRDLAGAARIRLAARAVERGQDARSWLEGVAAGSRYASRARHMLGLLAFEQGEIERGRQVLGALWAQDSSYAARREVGLALGGRALDEGRWEDAHRTYEDIERDRTGNGEALRHILTSAGFDSLWATWDTEPTPSDALAVDDMPAFLLAERLAQASADLRARPALEPPPLDAPAPHPPSRWTVEPPTSEERGAVVAAGRALAEVSYERDRFRRAMAEEQERLADRQRYLGVGIGRAQREADTLGLRARLLDSLTRDLDALDARLRAVRDEAKRRVAMRAEQVREQGQRNLRWLTAMRRFYVEGPNRTLPSRTPPGYPSAADVRAREEALARDITDFVDRLAVEAPGLIDRSYERAWGPNLIDRAVAQRAEADSQLAWARALGAALDSTRLAASTSDSLRALEARVATLSLNADSLRGELRTLRAAVGRAAVERALQALDSEREAIDYGRAVSAYGLSVRLDRSVSADSARARGSAPADTTSADSELDDPEAQAWRARARAGLETFLERHPESFARGEMRFRLADLMLVDARQSFRDQMAAYVRDQAEGGRSRVALPVLKQSAALALYRTILREDSTFAHQDAVLFNAAMILADEGDPEAARFFERLVTAHPESRYGQEAHLRMGDMHFNERRFAASIVPYQRAAAGDDPSLRVIALYKMGWAHFNQERLTDAADAFRSVLDLYESGARLEINVNLAPEAEAYLIHSLARAGGARALADYFDRIGPRPYERRVLMAMGQHYRRYGMHAEAAATDELCLARFPQHADALLSAQRLAETYQRWDRPALARRARLDYASRFAPETEWSKAQSDSVRAAGADFARSSWTSVALHHHREARRGASLEDWRGALELYRKLLVTWPADSMAPTWQLHAGEASAQLGDHRSALAHYGAAAASGRDSIAEQASMQQVAVLDAWYERTRTSGAAAAPSRDSLAMAVLAAGDRLLEHYPKHPAADDVLWRQGNLAFAHGWYARAAEGFGLLASAHPGDPRTPLAASLRADALFRLGDFEAAGAAFESALTAAQRAGRDSLAKAAAAAIPICYYRHAEAVAAADSTQFAQYAPLFEKVASGWPQFEHAPRAQYRAGLAYISAGSPREGVRAMETLIRVFPRSEYVKDAHLQIARTWEASGELEKAAKGYLAFAERYAEDESAGEAWLRAADLCDSAGRGAQADTLRLAYIRKYPADVDAAMQILESLARRELADVTPERPVSRLLPAPAPRAVARDRKPKTAPPADPSHLAAYLRRAQQHPERASRDLLARVRYLQGEETRVAYGAARLGQPLDRSIAAKQALLDSVLARYRRSLDLGVSEWAHASAFRIGEALVGFGEALEGSERPADLSGEDLSAYEDVLAEQGAAFYDRGEAVWSDLLRQKGQEVPEDPWLTRAREALWKRLAHRFFYRPEVEFPLVDGMAPERKPRAEKKPAAPVGARDAGAGTSGYMQQEADRP